MIKAIMAVDLDEGIGKDGTLPWPVNREDLRHFKNLTTGHIVVMGSNTWNDPCFPNPLPNRENYVISSKEGFEGATVINTDFKNKIKELDANSDKDVWIIGGASIVTQCSEMIEEFHLTVIPGVYNCDVFLNFPFGLYELTLNWTGEESGNQYQVFRRNK